MGIPKNEGFQNNKDSISDDLDVIEADWDEKTGGRGLPSYTYQKKLEVLKNTDEVVNNDDDSGDEEYSR